MINHVFWIAYYNKVSFDNENREWKIPILCIFPKFTWTIFQFYIILGTHYYKILSNSVMTIKFK